MTRISILPENLANKIAAGEVVQRPESVVKELMENSIDANATKIEVIIKKAGKSLIQVIDNGEGMSEEDAMLCIHKHATSKISSYEDLEAIATLGFRGEALSSIAAVSQVEIRTERLEDELGISLRIDDSATVQKEKGSFPKGTSVAVKNLFYNTPARRNFLKTNVTELRHINDTFNKLALSNTHIHFILYLDDAVTFDYPPAELEERIQQVFGEEMLEGLIPVDERNDYLSVHGFVGKPSLVKKSRGDQYVFLNSRYVQSKQINHAVFSAFENILEKGDYPFFVLFLELDPRKIDVNVHPTKLEVRFEEEKNIYNVLLTIIRKALASYDLVPSLVFDNRMPDSDREKMRFNSFEKRPLRDDFSDRPTSKPPPQREGNISGNYSNDDIDALFSSISSVVDRKPGGEEAPHPFEYTPPPAENRMPAKTIEPTSGASEESPFIIQLHNKYILSQIRSGLMIIDQHVAHERILYEKAKKMMQSDFPFSQPLLFPRTMKLDAGTYGVMQEINDHLTQVGFDLKFQKDTTVVVEGVPQDVKQGAEEKVLLEIVEEYVTNEREKELEETDNMAKSYSCTTAIKAGDKLSEREMRLLIDQLFATSMPYVCPHGRPVVVKISLDEFDKRFGRT